MGLKQTKIEDKYLSNTPTTEGTPRFISMNSNNANNTNPRSAYGYRTPIEVKHNSVEENTQLVTNIPDGVYNNENTFEMFRKRFLKSFTYNSIDPRSPSQNLNRTPLVFEDTCEKSLNLDDTFADLFVDSNLQNALLKLESDVEIAENKVVIDLEHLDVPQTPKNVQQQVDPRSPSIGVERTPIIFTDEIDDTSEDNMLESILDTLTLHLSNSASSSMMSMTPQNTKNDVQLVPFNKHLHRVRTGKKCSTKVNHLKPKQRSKKQNIYVDQENDSPVMSTISHTNKNDSPMMSKISHTNKNDSMKDKRTPLSCVCNRNRTHGRSRSVESPVKSFQSLLAISSFDDSLNPSENYKDSNLLIIQKHPLEQ